MFSYVLDAAIQLGIFDILAKAGPDAHISSYEIASQLHANNPDAPSLVDRMLRLLACYDLVTCVSRNLDGDEDGNSKVERLYGLALPGKAFVRDENGGSLAAFTASKAKMEVWYIDLCLIYCSNFFFREIEPFSLRHFTNKSHGY